MRRWPASRLAQAAGADLVAGGGDRPGPDRVVIDSRQAQAGDLFVGLPGTRVDGGEFAEQALARGAWGALTTAAAARALKGGVRLVAADPLRALQSLATAWRRELDPSVIGITGSTGKTSTKDLLRALLSPHRPTVASQANFNTEIGLPLEICNAPEGTEALVLEMGMRGPGQIAELARIAEPEVGVIVSIGPVHLELLGTVEAIAAAKFELIAGLSAGGTAIIPADEPLLQPHRRDDVNTITFGAGGDVRLLGEDRESVSIDLHGRHLDLQVPFTQAHLRRNLLAAVAASHAVGVTPEGRLEVSLSPGRGQRERLSGQVILIDDSYNANPMSMRAALDDLRATAGSEGSSRRVAILGDMLELGPEEESFHQEIGAHAHISGVDLLITVGPLSAVMSSAYDGEAYAVADAGEAAALAQELVRPGDAVLVKASRGIGLELVCQALREGVTA